MPVTVQVLYPTTEGLTFNHDYYLSTHMGLVGQHMGEHIQSAQVVKGLAGGPDAPSPFFAIATMVFADKQSMDTAMAAAGPVLADIPNFYNGQPHLINAIGSTTELVVMHVDFSVDTVSQYSGTPLRMFIHGDQLHLVTDVSSQLIGIEAIDLPVP